MRDILVTLLVFGAIPFIFVRPYFGVLVWSWLSLMSPHRLCFGFAYSMPFAQIVAIATVFGFFYYREKIIPKSTSVLWFWIFFVLWTGVTTYFAIYPEEAFVAWNKFMKISFMVFLTIVMTSDKQKLHALVWVVAMSLAFYGFKGGIYTILTGGGGRVWGPSGSFIEDNNALALAMVMVLPLIRYLQLNTDSLMVRKGLLALMGFVVLAILGTQSRGGFLGLAVMGIYLIWKSRHKFTLAIIAVIAIPFIISFMPESWHERMASIKNYKQDTSATRRIEAWTFAINFAKDHPIVGGGFAGFSERQYSLYAPGAKVFTGAHSIYFEVLGEHGYVGLSLFLLLGFTTFFGANRIRKKAKHYDDMLWASDLATMLQVSLVGYAISGAFLELATFDLYYVLVSMVIVLNTLMWQRERSEETKTEDRPVEIEGVQIVGVGKKPA